MTLSEHEERVLAQIDAYCHWVDPMFARHLDLVAVRRRRDRLTVFARDAFWIGWVTLLAGAGIATGLLSVGSIIACYGFVIMVGAAASWLYTRDPRRRVQDRGNH